MKNTSNFFNEVYFGGDFGNTWQSIFKYSENWNSSSGWTLIFGKFSGEYDLILLTKLLLLIFTFFPNNMNFLSPIFSESTKTQNSSSGRTPLCTFNTTIPMTIIWNIWKFPQNSTLIPWILLLQFSEYHKSQ